MSLQFSKASSSILVTLAGISKYFNPHLTKASFSIVCNLEDSSIVSSLLQSSKADSPMLSTWLSVVITHHRLEHPLNVSGFILLTFHGRLIILSELQSSKAPLPMNLIRFGRHSLSILLASEKAYSPIAIRLAGIVTSDINLQPSKACWQIALTPSGI